MKHQESQHPKTPKRYWVGILLLVATLGLVGCLGFEEAQSTTSTNASSLQRADLIEISTISISSSKGEMPPTTFSHDLHTVALAGQGKDCSSCHSPIEGAAPNTYSYKLKGTENATSMAEFKEAFHSSCISCHDQESAAGNATGPLAAACRSCHNPEPPVSSRQPAGLDASLHARHVLTKAIPATGVADKNCGSCHHVYDASTQQRVWAEKQEDSCYTCHGDVAKDKQPALQDAVHTTCISCHMTVAKTAQPSGPANCAGCHSAAAQAEYKRLETIPRLERGQPDATMLMPLPADAPTTSKKAIAGMANPVAFNHKFHEEQVLDCRSCHHKKIASCNSCHSQSGAEEGNYVQLYQVMHDPKSERSCMGCHATQQQKAECASCHSAMPEKLPQSSCMSCHKPVAGEILGNGDARSDDFATNGNLLQLSKIEREELAQVLLSTHKPVKGTVDPDLVPETVEIGILSNEYEASKLPHRKIVQNLTNSADKSRLAGFMHQSELTLCQGCHHNSPATATPPKCASCHSVDNQAVDGRPGLKAAYHQQCMTCHAALQLEKPISTDCTSCHKLKN